MLYSANLVIQAAFCHAEVPDYECALDLFLGKDDDFFGSAMESLSKCKSFADICSVLSSVEGMPFTLARLPQDLASDCVHLFLGQDYKDGWTFANQKKGSSMPVRFVHRKSGLRDNQFATYDVLPCNHDWKHDLDYFVACEDCRPALMKSKDYANLKHIDPKLPEEPKKCRKCKRRWTRLMNWLCFQLAGMVRAACLSGAKIFVTPGGSVGPGTAHQSSTGSTKKKKKRNPKRDPTVEVVEKMKLRLFNITEDMTGEKEELDKELSTLTNKQLKEILEAAKKKTTSKGLAVSGNKNALVANCMRIPDFLREKNLPSKESHKEQTVVRRHSETRREECKFDRSNHDAHTDRNGRGRINI